MPHRRKHTTRAAMVVTAALALAACGSTVPTAERRAAASGGGSGSDAGDASFGPAGEAGNGASVSDAQTSAGPSGSTAAGTRRPATGANGTSIGPGAVGAAIKPNAPVDVGVFVDKNLAAFAAAFGATTSQPEEKAVAQAIIADINQHGGFAGHPVNAIYAEFDSTSSDWIAQDQAACSLFTEDHHVISVMRNDDIFGPLDTCLARAGIPLVLYESYFRAPSWYRATTGLRFVPDNPSAPRLYKALVDRLVDTKRWTPSTKIGLVRYDRNDQGEIETDAVVPALAARGLKLTQSAAVHTPESFQDIGTTSSQLPAVIVKFRQAGINDVLFEGGDISYLFSTEAESQQYRPRYALTSFDFPNAMPTEQLHGAFGAGWEPSDDLVSGLPTLPGGKRCQQAVRSTNPQFDGAGIDRIYITCDQLYFMKAAYDAAGDVGPGSLALGAKRLGAGFAPAYTFGIDASAHPDGATAFRDLMFDEDCACLVYGPQHPLP